MRRPSEPFATLEMVRGPPQPSTHLPAYPTPDPTCKPGINTTLTIITRIMLSTILEIHITAPHNLHAVHLQVLAGDSCAKRLEQHAAHPTIPVTAARTTAQPTPTLLQNFISSWFRGAPVETIGVQNVTQWVAYMLYSKASSLVPIHMEGGGAGTLGPTPSYLSLAPFLQRTPSRHVFARVLKGFLHCV